jgi:hypothetical protein
MAAFLATLSAAGARNWAICKRHRLWGTGGSSHAKHAARNLGRRDDLFVWQSGDGLIAQARIESPARPVTDVGVVPWPDPQRYTYVFDISVVRELAEPIGDRFREHRSVRFGIRTHELQAGLIQISDEVAASLRSALQDGTVAPLDVEPPVSPARAEAPANAGREDSQPPTSVEPRAGDVQKPPVDEEPYRDRRWTRPMAGVYLRPSSSVTEVLLTLYRRVADDEDGELLVVGDERDRLVVERELRQEPFVEMRDRVRFVTGSELAAELQRRFPSL